MGSWVASVLGSCMFLPSLLLATGSRKSDLLSPVRFQISDSQLLNIYKRISSINFLSFQESQHVVLDLGQLSLPQWSPNCWKCLTGSGPTESSPDSASWYFFCLNKHVILAISSVFLQSPTYSSWIIYSYWVISSIPQCTFLGLTMKPVPKPKCDSIDSITEMKQKNGPIIKVWKKVRGFTSLIWILQNDKAFNASKEDMEFIDNNEETNKVTNSTL